MDNKATRLAEYIFFSLPISLDKSDDYGYEYYNDGYICGICGYVVNTYGRRGGVFKHILRDHPEWMHVHIILGEYNSKTLKKVQDFALNLLTSDIVFAGRQCRNVEEYREYYCLLCGIPQYKESCLSHIELNHPEWINAIWFNEKREKYGKKLRAHPLKPWKDPESLFCSPNLKNIINKEPLRGKECRDPKI